MKKNLLLTISLLLCTPTIVHSSTDAPKNDSQTDISHQIDIEDDFDFLIEQALEHNLVKDPEPTKPSKMTILTQKMGILLFLKPYIYIVHKYRCIKNFIKKYTEVITAYFSKKEAQAETHE